MGKLFGFIFCTLVISGNILIVQGAVYSSTDTSLRFSQCLIEKMSESQLFTEDDRNAMIEVANVMSQAMLNQYQTNLPERALLTAFMTSMADVITHFDVAKNADRKSFYVAALEQCSLWTTGYIDRDFVEESLRILSTIEESKFPKFADSFQDSNVGAAGIYRAYVNPEEPNVFNPLAVQPSPVQNPDIQENFDSNVKTISEVLHLAPDSYSITPKSNSGSHSQFRVPSSEVSQESGAAIIGEISKDSSDFGGLNVPQTKESSVVVISPAINKQPVQRDSLPQPSKETAETELQPSSTDTAKLPTVAMTSAFLSQSGRQDQDVPYNPSLDNIVLNILVESAPFRNAFDFNISQENAINLARAATEKSLAGYSTDIINEVLTAVSDEVAKVSFRTPENYARALSNALVRVLKFHNLPLFINGSQIATRFLSNLDNIKRLSSQVGERLNEQHTSDHVNTEQDLKQVDFDFQSPPLAPEDTEGEIFSKVLAHYLSESKELADFFCNTDSPENKMKIYFSTIKSSLTEYGTRVSSIAAGIASGVLAGLSKDDLCSHYAQTISEVIAEILDENRALEGANAEDISKNMASILSQQSMNPESQKTENTTVKFPTKETLFVPNNTMPTFQSLDSTTSSNFNQASIDYMTSYENVNYRASYFPSKIYYTDSASYSFSAPPSSMQMFSSSEYEVNDDTSPVTTPYTIEISDKEFTNAVTLIKFITTISDASPTDSSLDWALDGVIDQKRLASHLLEEFETALENYYDEGSELEDFSSPADEILATAEATVDSAKSNTLTYTSLQSERNVQNANITHSISNAKSGNFRQRNGSDFLTEGKGIPPDNISENYVLGKTKCKDIPKGKNVSSLPEDSDVKVDRVELQPSFLGPQPTEYATRSVLPSKSDSAFYDIALEDNLTTMARTIAQIANSSVVYIRSGNFDINNLCARINDFAPIVKIPPLDFCEEIAAIDYILNVLRSAVTIFKGV